jgi:Flp pilus assembly protein TadG
VELSLTFLPFMALILAIIDFSMPVFLRSTFSHAAREGARYAITYRTFSGKSHTESIQDIVMQQSMGFLNGTAGRSMVKVKFYNPTTFVEETGANRNARGNIVEVTIDGFVWGYILPLWRPNDPVPIRAASADRLESPPNSVVLPVP